MPLNTANCSKKKKWLKAPKQGLFVDQKEHEIEITLGEQTMQQLKELANETGETLEQVAARLLEQGAAGRWKLPRAGVRTLKRER